MMPLAYREKIRAVPGMEDVTIWRVRSQSVCGNIAGIP